MIVVERIGASLSYEGWKANLGIDMRRPGIDIRRPPAIAMMAPSPSSASPSREVFADLSSRELLSSGGCSRLG